MDDFDDLSNADFLDDLSADPERGDGEKAGGASGFREEFGFGDGEGTWDDSVKGDGGGDDYDYGDRDIFSRMRRFLREFELPETARRFVNYVDPEGAVSDEAEEEVDWGALLDRLLKVILRLLNIFVKGLYALLKYIAKARNHPFIKQFNFKQKMVLGLLVVGVVLVGVFGYSVVSGGGFSGFGGEDSKLSAGQTGTAIFLEAKMLEEKLTATRAAAARVEKNIASTATVSYRQTEYASLTTPTVAFTLAPNATYGLGVTPPTAEDAKTPVPSATALAGAACSCAGDLYQCADFSTHDEAQACYAYCIDQGLGDIHNIDIDQNEFACESLP